MLYTKTKRILKTEDLDNILWTYYCYNGTEFNVINSLGIDEIDYELTPEEKKSQIINGFRFFLSNKKYKEKNAI